ncbi:sensor histidine kinase [Amedibacillus sp. YH-ame6]
MKRRTESMRWRIFVYNIMLLLMVSLGCTMYYLLNDETINKYNDTFTTYNELNHVYHNAKEIHTLYTEYMSNEDETFIKQAENSEKEALQGLQNVKDAYGKVDQDKQFTKLKSSIQEFYQYVKNATYTIDAPVSKDQVHQQFINIMRSRGDYYEILTKDMQFYKNQVHEHRLILGWMSVLLIILMIIWIIYFSRTMLKSITDPIEKIVHNMKQIKKGEYDLTQISNANVEMNELCIALEDMADSVQKNIQYAEEKADLEKRVLEQQNENLKKDELLIQGELRVLQNQINPHFLFNTLNMIYKKAYSEGAYETSELMEKTSQLLRYSLDTIHKVSTLREELKAIENYMFLQENRFGERITFHLYVDLDIQNIHIPTMVLQPLVENAVTHGLKDTITDGEVIVSASMNGTDILLSVSDNGIGMSAHTLEELILNEYRIQDEEREHIGLYNVTKRLKTFFKDQVEIIVNSSEDCGFEIVMKIKGEEI